MALSLSEGMEPIPGYKLETRLGFGGYGEVWRTTAPGGFQKAIKIIPAEIGDARAEQELKALNRIKEVRHPFLLSLERIETTGRHVFIVMELADGSLMDRFQQCQKAGLPSVPRDELLAHLRDAADALDYMNEQYGLQHLDIKPQNLLIVGGRIKIGDFGLVKELNNTHVTVTGGVTPLYAPPEAFDGTVTRFSDQYSLAIVFQEMLTGHRPFPGKTTLQLAFQHLNSPPLLDPLPASDRPVLARALSKVPEARFPTCRQFVEALGRPQETTTPADASARAAVPRSPSVAPETPTLVTTSLLGSDKADLLELDTLASPVASPAPGPITREKPSFRSNSPLVSGTQLRPTLFVGIGGLAGMTLSALHQRLQNRFGPLHRIPVWQLLLLDTDRSALRAIQQESDGGCISADNTLSLVLKRPEHYRHHAGALLKWLDRRWLYQMPRSQRTEGMRSLGRLAFVDHADEVRERLQRALEQITSPQARETATDNTGVRAAAKPQVLLVAGISGATGGGMISDAAAMLRAMLGDFGLNHDALSVFLLHATGRDPTWAELARVNAYASLIEWNHFLKDSKPWDAPGKDSETSSDASDMLMGQTYLVSLGEELDEAQARAAAHIPAELLYLHATTPLGDLLDQPASVFTSHSEVSLRTFGMAQILFPRYVIANQVGAKLAQDLVKVWLGAPKAADVDDVQDEIRHQCQTLGLERQQLMEELRGETWSALGGGPETVCQRSIIEPLFAEFAGKTDSKDAGQRLLELLQTQLGIVRDLNACRPTNLTPLEDALYRHADERGEQVAQAAIGWLNEMLEDPEARLGAAERAGALLSDELNRLSEEFRSTARGLASERGRLLERMAHDGVRGTKSGFRPRSRRKEATESAALVAEICQLHFQEIVVQHVLALLQKVSARILELNRDFALVREKTVHLANVLADSLCARGAERAPIPGCTELLPEGSSSTEATANALYETLPADFALRVDRVIQKEVLEPRGGLRQLMIRDYDSAEAIGPELLCRCRDSVMPLVRGINGASLFLASLGRRDQAGGPLAAFVDQARPRLVPGNTQTAYFVGLPVGPDGGSLKEAMTQITWDHPTVLFQSEGPLVAIALAEGVSFADAANALVGSNTDYSEVARQAQTRIDVAWMALAG